MTAPLGHAKRHRHVLAEMLGNPGPLLDRLDRMDAESSLRDYIPYVWDVIEPGRRFVPGWAVDAVCEHLEAVTRGEIRRLVMNVPPGCMKSLTTEVLWPTWEWGPKNLPTTRYVCASYSEALTIRDNRRARNVILSDVYQNAWGDRFQLSGDQNQKVKFENDRTGFKLATSVGGLGTGERGDRFIIDDPHNIKTAESDAKRDDVLQWFSEVVPTRLNDAEESVIIVIMQRVHERDVSGLILAEELGYEHLCLPMEYERRRRCYTSVRREGVEPERVCRVIRESEPPVWCTEEELEPELAENPAPEGFEPKWVYLTPQDRRDEEGALLWPERFSARYLEEDLKPSLRSWGGTYAEAGQLQQSPVARGGGMFLKANWRYVDEEPAEGRAVRGWDLAATDDDPTSAYTVGCKMRLFRGRVYICHVERFRGTDFEVETRMRRCAEMDGHAVQVDYPQDPGQSGKAQKRYLGAVLQGFDFVSSTESGDKVTRARPLAAQQEAGNVYLVRGAWNQAFVSEGAMFPRGRFKDQIDAASRAYANLVRKRERRVGAAPQRVTSEGDSS